jgi:hypothetical protein
VVHCAPWGHGAEAVLGYLARYVFRAAISNSRIESLDKDGVTFRHKHRASNRWRLTRLSGPEFMRRFLQHVLPKGLHKVRYFGLWHLINHKGDCPGLREGPRYGSIAHGLRNFEWVFGHHFLRCRGE